MYETICTYVPYRLAHVVYAFMLHPQYIAKLKLIYLKGLIPHAFRWMHVTHDVISHRYVATGIYSIIYCIHTTYIDVTTIYVAM